MKVLKEKCLDDGKIELEAEVKYYAMCEKQYVCEQ